jgi:hypothetical protein
MTPREQCISDEYFRADEILISRRAAIGSSAVVVLTAVSGVSLGQDGGFSGLPKEIQERMAKSREFSLRMRNAATEEERNQIMAERNAWEQTRAVEDIKGQLGVSDEEWKVIQPRVEAVYSLVHPRPQFGRSNARQMSPVEQRKNELHQTLNDKAAAPEQIRAKLTALRSAQIAAAQELTKARQNLRQILTLRQEATLVLNGLLD